MVVVGNRDESRVGELPQMFGELPDGVGGVLRAGGELEIIGCGVGVVNDG